ncbi:hypothetical protein DACRYDRAFT_13374 [Dacryopinax primogenitus]|uniref:Uncharacterized protein n=1 Tax=Dacryopinax primogenitus (strain DJM 731) TaxID=1858805 RepID=M5G4W5_DACPD|nr:uncharacterized protein DACRYDRAFT_13374 [Dacryopinax primogenitus]EJU05306.1 hypothetical protein DACRYDRAFT_13374 [Dacryopinax primogenitus]
MVGPPPNNELLNLYRQARSPQEGLANVAKYVGEFMALLRLDMEISGFFVAPVPGNIGQAVNCNDHWFLGAPLKARPGFDHPVGGSWQIPDPPVIAAAPMDVDDEDCFEAYTPDGLPQTVGGNEADGKTKTSASATPLIEEEDEDLVIHYDDAPVTRALGRAFKDSEVVQAREDIRRIQAHPDSIARELVKLDWHARKRTCHLHIIAFMLIWRGKLEVGSWTHGEKKRVIQDPTAVYDVPLVVDSLDNEIRFGRNLEPDQIIDASDAIDTPSPSREGSVSIRRTLGKKKLGRPPKLVVKITPTPTPSLGPETSHASTSVSAETPQPKRRGRPPKNPKPKLPEVIPVPQTPPAAPTPLSPKNPTPVVSKPATPPSPQPIQLAEDVDFHRYVEDPRRDNKRFFTDAQVIETQQVILDRGKDLEHARDWIEQFDWNTRRKLCRLHLNAFLFEQLGNTEFHEILERLHRKRLRLVGWPHICELPGGQHVGNWNKLQIEALFTAIWSETLRFAKWDPLEQAKDYPYLIEDTLGGKHSPKPEQVDIERDHDPLSLTYGLPMDLRKLYLAHLARDQARGKGKERADGFGLGELEGEEEGEREREETPSSEGRRYGLRKRRESATHGEERRRKRQLEERESPESKRAKLADWMAPYLARVERED